MLELPPRPAEAILGRTVTLRFSGGVRYVLPVLTISENRRWKAELDQETASLVDALSASGDDAVAILSALATQTDKLVDLLYSYDTSHVLPERAVLEGIAYEDEILVAVQEVWQAANPLVVMALAMALETSPSSDSSAPTNTSPPPTAGSRRKSSRSSPTSSSSPTSTRRTTASNGKPVSSSSPG